MKNAACGPNQALSWAPDTRARSLAHRFQPGKTLRIVGTSLGALAMGLFGLFLIFPAGSFASEVGITVTFLFVAGAIIGLASPRSWMLSGLVAWGMLLLVGLVIKGGSINFGLSALLAAGSVCLALFGGYVGFSVRRLKRLPGSASSGQPDSVTGISLPEEIAVAGSLGPFSFDRATIVSRAANPSELKEVSPSPRELAGPRK